MLFLCVSRYHLNTKINIDILVKLGTVLYSRFPLNIDDVRVLVLVRERENKYVYVRTHICSLKL